jgi:hypothetical protein
MKWEHKVQPVGVVGMQTMMLTSFGLEGWELVAVSNSLFYFKLEL